MAGLSHLHEAANRAEKGALSTEGHDPLLVRCVSELGSDQQQMQAKWGSVVR